MSPQPLETKLLPAKINDLRGRVFHYLTVTHFRGIMGHHAYWCCKCKCGNSVKVRGTKLVQGKYKSCGCYRANSHVRLEARMKVSPERRAEIARAGQSAMAKKPRTLRQRHRYTLTVDQVADVFLVSTERVHHMVDIGAIAGRMTGGRLLLSARDVDAMDAAIICGGKRKGRSCE